MRLDRYLANAGFGSRTEVKEMIRQGLVRIDGQVCRDAGQSVSEDGSSSISLNELPILLKKQIHLMMNKPAGLITAMDDPRHRTIAELIPPRFKSAGLFPVGRLDIDATGLLLLTNDGTLCHRLASPRWEVWKTYAVTIQGKVFEQSDILQFEAGLELADGLKCRPAQLTVQEPQKALLTIHEGKFHQVKRMMLATGRRVTSLRRIRIGPLLLDQKLAPGECRELTAAEAAELYHLVELATD
ncbi:MAG TPA: 16S rRNA pseudouridine(516) synthase [Clostridiales bacterium]|nr:16S rRNA pseudouridine(516) synthase [Clostridiales bacterium]